MKISSDLAKILKVTPYAGVWIEIISPTCFCGIRVVTPYAGVWIEIFESLACSVFPSSLPTRECGLKLSTDRINASQKNVTPYAGVWIEISRHFLWKGVRIVTPYAGVWIEIIEYISDQGWIQRVTPYAGVWIEIL